jgi:hypothetical protein
VFYFLFLYLLSLFFWFSSSVAFGVERGKSVEVEALVDPFNCHYSHSPFFLS